VFEEGEFQHILRILNTNINGEQKVMYALTSIKGIGRRFSNLIVKRAQIDLNKRAGELNEEEIEKLVEIISHPADFNIPEWFLNSRKDYHTNQTGQVVSNWLDAHLRDNIERLKKMRIHRGLRHWWGLRCRGQHGKSTGRKGKTVGVAKRKP
jgi:small subunit ribosomal protein S18e